MFALEIILHLLDFAFGFCCCFIYISALSNTLLHVIGQVRNISIEEKHREGRLLKIVITLSLSLSLSFILQSEEVVYSAQV